MSQMYAQHYSTHTAGSAAWEKGGVWYRGGGGGTCKIWCGKFWFGENLVRNTMENVVENFYTVHTQGIVPGTSSAEVQYFYNSATCFLCYSPVKQASKLKIFFSILMPWQNVVQFCCATFHHTEFGLCQILGQGPQRAFLGGGGGSRVIPLVLRF